MKIDQKTFALGMSIFALLLLAAGLWVYRDEMSWNICRLYVLLTTGEWVKLPSISFWNSCGYIITR